MKYFMQKIYRMASVLSNQVAESTAIDARDGNDYLQPPRKRYCGFSGCQIIPGSLILADISSRKFFAICQARSSQPLRRPGNPSSACWPRRFNKNLEPLAN